MRIVFGVCGEGMGHATRSRVSIDHLASRGHEVLVAASGQAQRVFARSPHRVLPIVGLTMRCEEGGLDLRGSLEDNARRLPLLLITNASAWAAAQAFRPDAVVSDFDFFAWATARALGVPLVSIDNGLAVNLCETPQRILPDGPLTSLQAFNRCMVPDADRYVLTTFSWPRVRTDYERTVTLVPPILRREVLDATRSLAPQPAARGAHVLVYKTGSLDDESFLGALARVPEARFLVYGLKAPDARLPPNVTPRPFDEAAFLRDVATSRGVVGNGGMSLIGEALALGRPIHAVPVRGQFEQVLNAGYIRELGYGSAGDALEPDALRAFLERAPEYERAIRARPQHDDNALLYATLDQTFPR